MEVDPPVGVSQNAGAGDSANKSRLEWLVKVSQDFRKLYLWEGRHQQLSEEDINEALQSINDIMVGGLLRIKPRGSKTEPDDDTHVMAFCEWYSRFAITVYGNIDPGFKEWPFGKIHESLEVMFTPMTNQKKKCSYFAREFSNLLLSVINVMKSSSVKPEEWFNAHLQKLPGKFPEIRYDLKAATLQSVIIGVCKILIFFRKTCHIPSFDQSEIIQVFDVALTTSNVEVQNIAFELFKICADLKSWSYGKVDHFIDAKFGQLLNVDPQSILNNSPEFTSNVEALLKIIEHTKNQVWVECSLLFLIKMAWNAEQEILGAIKQIVLKIGSLIDSREGVGGRMFKKHSEFLLTKLIKSFVKEESNDESNEAVGKIFQKILTLFDLSGKDLVNYVLPLTLIKVLLLDTPESKDLFVDILNEYATIDFKRYTQYFPALISQLIEHLKWNSIVNAVTFIEKLWNVKKSGENGWSVLFKNQAAVIEVLLHISSQKDIVFSIMENYALVNRSKAKFEKNEKFIGALIEEFGLMKSIILEVNKKVSSEPCSRITRNETTIQSLIYLINVVNAKGVASVQSALGSLVKNFTQFTDLSNVECELIADLYFAYLNNLNQSELELNLDHICKDLVLLLPRAPISTVKALKLVILNKGASDGAIAKLSFLPLSNPDLEEVRQKIENVKVESKDVTVRVVKHSDDAFTSQELDLKDVRLQILHRYIEENYIELIKFGDFSSSWISKVYSNLIADSRIPDKFIRQRVAACMGQIGAIDPAKFELIPCSDSQAEISNFDMGSNEFAGQLVSRLGDFLIKTSDFGTKIAFFEVIRKLKEILTSDQIKFAIGQISVVCQKEIDEATQYDPTGKYNVFAEIEGLTDKPIFNPDMSYEIWLRKWTKKMIFALKPSSKERKIFESCAILFNSDYRLAEMLLPCIVYHILMSTAVGDAEKRQMVNNEIHTVIKSAIPFSNHMSTFEVSSPLESRITVSAVSLNQTQHSCAQQIFILFDRLSREQRSHNIKASIEKILYIHLAHLAYGCQSYARSLSYLEQHVHERTKHKRDPKIELHEEEIHLLQKVYVALDDPDGVSGVNAIRKNEPDIMDRILAHEATNHLQDALACCEKGVKSNPDSVDYSKMMLRCLLSLDQPSTAFKYSLGLLTEKPDWRSKVKPYMVEAAWKLGMWDELDKLTSENSAVEDVNMSQSIGKLLVLIQNKQEKQVAEVLAKAMLKEMNPISAMAPQRAAYLRSYQHLVRLHMLTDIERASQCLFGLKQEPTGETMTSSHLSILWNLRNESILPSLRTLEPVLSLQRVLYHLATSNGDNPDRFSVELASSWLQSAKIARRSGNDQRAYNCLLETQQIMETNIASKDLSLVSEFLIEKTKHGWVRQDSDSKEKAAKELARGITKHFGKHLETIIKVPNSPGVRNSSAQDPPPPSEYLRAIAKSKLLWIRITDQMENLDKKDVAGMYSEVSLIDKKWEKPYFHLAKLYDRMASSENLSQSDKLNHQHLAAQNYFHSLRQGCKYSQESLPRLLELWFDMSFSGIDDNPPRTSKSPRTIPPKPGNEQLKLISKIIENLSQSVPSYVLYTAFSQVMSRFNHPNPEVARILTVIVTKLVNFHPKQVVWKLMAYHFLKDEQRSGYLNVLNTVLGCQTNLYRRVLSVADALIDLVRPSNVHYSNSTHYLTSQSPIVRLLKQKDCVPILLPSEKFMKVSLPPSGLNEDSHVAFDPKEVYIDDIEKKMEILSSLAKPKKISFCGSDGRNYTMMIKPKDDLRFDGRTLELCDVLNRLLKKDPETRKRRLKIRTFAVVPFTAEAGLVEWVDGLRDIRSILVESYEKYRGMKDMNINELYPHKSESPSSSIKKFQEYVLPKFKPPVFGEWFARQFPDATAWQLARNNYVRSTAVMSMVGYIIGLGDRHLENILFDLKSGEVVHVDFNCIFNRGEKLDVPEIVPFRLTHNMVDAMGLTGFEGHYRRTCEETMRVMRSNQDMLMSVLNPFVFDPFVGAHQSRSKKQPGKKVTADSEINQENKKSIDDIKDRLSGIVNRKGERNPFPLSVTGQVNHLIDVASDEKQLCKMYFGWSSFL